jgi:DNA mismatch endonuclease (patch repair protein)
MVDVMSADKRSALMSRIRGKDTAPELHVRKSLWRAGLRYRLHTKDLPGKPDLVLPKWKAVVFVHGCFWHRHVDCSYFRLPKTRSEFWDEKLRRNQERDETAISTLAKAGWRIAIVWECAVRNDPDAVGRKLATWVKQGTAGILIEEVGKTVQARPFRLPRQ